MSLPKYRAWDYDDKQMWKVIGWSETIWGDCEDDYLIICDFDESPRFKETNVRHSLEFKLMQFTGLKDKNGREIYEGDILEFNDCSYARTAGHVDDKILKSKVEFYYGAFWVDGILLLDAIQNDEELEIVGNIYENPELLEATA